MTEVVKTLRGIAYGGEDEGQRRREVVEVMGREAYRKGRILRGEPRLVDARPGDDPIDETHDLQAYVYECDTIPSARASWVEP